MKKILVILSVLVCIFGLSVSSMAYQSKSVLEIPFIRESDGIHSFSEILVASKYPDTTQEKWKEMCSILQSGGSNEKFVVVTVSPNDGSYQCGWISFLLIEGGFQYKSDASGFPSVVSNKGGFEAFSFSFTDAGHSSQGPIIQHYGSVTSFPIGVKSSASRKFHYILRGASRLHSISPLPDNAYVIEDVDRFLFEDDLGTFEEPEEPDLPSSSSPAWTPPVVSDPVIPEGDEYVFYDTKILGIFLNHVRSQIVRAANVGWLIFGFILVWHVIKRVIKAFSSR